MGKSSKKTKVIRQRQKNSGDQKPRSLGGEISGKNFTLKISGSLKDWNNFYEHYFYSPAIITSLSRKLWKDLRPIAFQVLSDEINKKSRSYSKKVFRNTVSIYSALLYETIKVSCKRAEDDPLEVTFKFVKQLFDEGIRYYRGEIFPSASDGLHRHYILPGENIIRNNPAEVREAFNLFNSNIFGTRNKTDAYKHACLITLALSHSRTNDETRKLLLTAFPSLKEIIS